MKKKPIFIIALIILISNAIFCQTTGNTELPLKSTPDSIIFQNHLDSIEKYMYRDSKRVPEFKSLCEEMLIQEKELTNANRFEFVLQDIYYQYVLDSIMKVVQLIESNRKMLELDDIPYVKRKTFKYLDGFTSMIIGESETAQASFLQLLDDATQKNDSSMIFRSTYSMGEIFFRQKDFNTAEKYFLDAYDLILKLNKNPVSILHVYFGLVDIYIEKKDFDQALYYNEIAIQSADSIEALDLKFDFLLKQVSILIQKNKIIKAEKFYKEAEALAQRMDNSFYIGRCKQASILFLKAKSDYQAALEIYENLIANQEKGENVLTTLLSLYEGAHEVAKESHNYPKAHHFLLKSNEIKDSLSSKEQLQKIQYVKIKFDVEQKEKENEILTAQIVQKKSQNQLLYALALIFILLSILLIGNTIHRRKYNNQLKTEVKIRTKELEKANILLSKSNEELFQFTNILSHDLKEPLRSIVGFSSLAKKHTGENKKLKEYLNYISKGGKQLHQLIDDVATFQKVGNITSNNYKLLDLNLFTTTILESIDTLLSERNAKVFYTSLPSICCDQSVLFIIFKNLIENGIKYNQSDVPTVHITYIRKDNMHCIMFQDNGIGIAPQFHEKVFGMFKRLNDRRSYSGSGLGLNIVKKIINKVDGDVGILTSEEGKGSTFVVSLPIIKNDDNHFYNMNIPNSN